MVSHPWTPRLPSHSPSKPKPLKLLSPHLPSVAPLPTLSALVAPETREMGSGPILLVWKDFSDILKNSSFTSFRSLLKCYLLTEDFSDLFLMQMQSLKHTPNCSLNSFLSYFSPFFLSLSYMQNIVLIHLLIAGCPTLEHMLHPGTGFCLFWSLLYLLP